MSHFLQPSSDDEEEVPINKNKKQQQEQPTVDAPKSVRISIDDDDGDDVQEKAAAPAPAPASKSEASSSSSVPAPAATPANAAALGLRSTLGGPVAGSEQFAFSVLQRPFPMMQTGGDKETAERMQKWGLAESMSVAMFSFDMASSASSSSDNTAVASKSANVPGTVHAGMLPDLALALLNSEEFRVAFQCGDGHGGKVAVEYPTAAGASAVTLQQLRATQTTLEMFDKLSDSHPESLMSQFGGPSIVRDSGALSNMADEFLPCGVTVSDQLRGVFMLGDESEAYNVFSEEDRSEFLWHVMQRVVAGGAVNQYEDEFAPYKEAAREIYKSLISVGRVRGSAADDAENHGKKLEVQSLVCQVKDVRAKNDKGKLHSVMKSVFFPKDDRTDNHNWMYLVVDPVRRTVCVWYNAFFSPF